MIASARPWAQRLLYALLAIPLATAQTTFGYEGASSDQVPELTSSASASTGTAAVNGTETTYSVQYTPPAVIDVGQNILPNILDPNSTDAQKVCPGYIASNLERTITGFTATLALAGEAVGITKLYEHSYIG